MDAASETITEAWRQDWLRANLRAADVPGGGGLRYLAAHPGSGLSRLAEVLGEGGDAPPYWAYLWPGGAALIAYILENGELFRGRRVLDLGAGCGLAGIAARRAGAVDVLCVDVDPMAQSVARANAVLNGVEVAVAGPSDWECRPGDVVLAGDVFYSPEVAQASAATLAHYARRGAKVLVGDIGRADLPEARLTKLASYPVRDVGDGPSAPLRIGHVWRFRPGAETPYPSPVSQAI